MKRGRLDRLAIDFAGGLEETTTAFAGAGLLIELNRACGVMAAADKYLPAKQRAKGLSQGQMVEAMVLLSALGGECPEDLERLRQDEGLAAMTGYRLPAAPTARQWLEKFHAQEKLAGRPQQGSFIPEESDALAGLGSVIEHSIRTYVSACQPGPEVTMDVDAHLVESHKQTALPTYEGYRGYQPMIVSWAEANLVMKDEFRDGNVPASRDIARMVEQAYGALPEREGGWQVSVRSDSAAYEQEILEGWDRRGWIFAVSADMTPQLREAVGRVEAEGWHVLREERDGWVREWAEVDYVPSRYHEKRDSRPYRYVAVRIRSLQGMLFGDGTEVKHFAVVSNDWERGGQELLEWHRGKQGTVEQVHRVLKDELGAGVYPSGKFGANAAWLRLQALTHNLLELLKAAGLDDEFRRARPKKLRLWVFSQFGRVVSHARQQVMRVATTLLQRLIEPAGRKIGRRSWAPA